MCALFCTLQLLHDMTDSAPFCIETETEICKFAIIYNISNNVIDKPITSGTYQLTIELEESCLYLKIVVTEQF